jgi:hypothetical protein
MTTKSLADRLADLEASRYEFGSGRGARVLNLLSQLNATRFPGPATLIRFHEALLFLRAFPQNHRVLQKTERMLDKFVDKVQALRNAGADMDDFDPLEVSGIAGTLMEDTLSFDLAQWLVQRMPGKVEIAWDSYEPGRELGTAGPRFMPLLEDDANVEADTPWRKWLETAGGTKSATPTWLLKQVARLRLPALHKAELYESLRIPLQWDLGNSRISRTRNWKSVRNAFYHDGPLISRSEVSLAKELAERPPSFTRLSRREGEAIADRIREVMLVRYRELYGTTLVDPRSVVRADVGRGVSIYLWSLPPERRLPLRAYVAGFTLKNGVPINYIEAIGLCEWMEVGFNTFYTFRGGEAGWIYAQVLRCLCSRMGITVVSVYPYQLGHENDEAIESGAFWFYRKLGFRPGREDLAKLAQREEKKIAADPRYRTPARTLKRLAAGHAFYELPGSEPRAWDSFSTRNIGLRANRRMARKFRGDAVRMRKDSSRRLERILGVSIASWTSLEKASFENFAVILAEVPALRRWSRADKAGLVEVIRAKTKPDEMLYLHLTQQSAGLREALLRLGS